MYDIYVFVSKLEYREAVENSKDGTRLAKPCLCITILSPSTTTSERRAGIGNSNLQMISSSNVDANKLTSNPLLHSLKRCTVVLVTGKSHLRP